MTTQWVKDNDFLNKALFVPPDPSYTADFFGENLVWLGKKGSRIPVLTLLPPKGEIDYVICYCHGNGCDLGGVYPVLRMMRNKLGVAVVAPDYPGYGLSEGQDARPTESGLNETIIETYKYIKYKLEVPSQRIVLFGTSIGSGPVCMLAQDLAKKKIPVGAVILQSPFTSIKAVVQSVNFFESSAANFLARAGSWLITDRFENIKLVEHISFPLMVLHGDQDELVPCSHGKALFDKCKADFKQLVVFPGVGHNDFDWIKVVHKINTFLTKLSRLYNIEKKIKISAGSAKIKALREAKPEDVEVGAKTRWDSSSASASRVWGGTLATIFGGGVGLYQSISRLPSSMEEDSSPIQIIPIQRESKQPEEEKKSDV